MINILGNIFLVTGLLMLSGRKMKTAIILLAMQSLSLSMIAFFSGYALGGLNWHMFIIGSLTILVKVIALPVLLYRLVNELNPNEPIGLSVKSLLSFSVGIVLVLFSYSYVVPEFLSSIHVDSYLLSAALSSILLGCFYMISRSCVLDQIIGIILMENGLFLSSLAITGGMPLIVELGIFFDILVGVLVMVGITYQIKNSCQSLDIKNLNRLRG
ncbi:MAG: hypothetical protein APF84_06280 [Gracilibacter sp. BRH_c7a]|nr:MAG: hypothetical protein APF84_06280 [Gracilibacter sp. BRH_c7a]